MIDSNAGKATVTLRVADIEVPHHVKQPKRSRNGGAQQRRRERRAVARQVAEEASKVSHVAEEASARAEDDKNEANDISEKENQGNSSSGNIAEEAIAAKEDGIEESDEKSDAEGNTTEEVPVDKTVNGKVLPVEDEFCPDSEFSEVKMCSVQIFPESHLDIEAFRQTVENYFKARTDIIEDVMECKLENYRSNIRLISIVKIRKVWLNFFNDPRGKYGDLGGVRRVIHDCQDLSNCDPVRT